MASRTQECEICNESYNTAEHKPIVLQCGHSFCRSCLLTLERQGRMKCPTCRQPVTLPVDQLPVNYAIIPSEETKAESKSNSETFERCQSHGFDLDNFCANCGVLICVKCVVKSHLQHCIMAEEDLFNGSQSSIDFAENVASHMSRRLDCVTKACREAEKVRDTVKKLEKCQEDIQQCLDTLRPMASSVVKDAEAWHNADTKSAAEKRELFKTLPRQWQNDFKYLCKDLISEVIKSNLEKIQETLKNLQESASMELFQE